VSERSQRREIEGARTVTGFSGRYACDLGIDRRVHSGCLEHRAVPSRAARSRGQGLGQPGSARRAEMTGSVIGQIVARQRSDATPVIGKHTVMRTVTDAATAAATLRRSHVVKLGG